MASLAQHSSIEELNALLRSASWADACAFYERALADNERAAPECRLGYAIALIRSGREQAGMALLRPEVTALQNARDDLRRYVVSPLVHDRQFELAADVLGIMIDANPSSIEDLRLRASLLGRLKRWPEAIADSETVALARPDDLVAQTAHIQLLLQGGQADEAGALAEAMVDRLAENPRSANIALLALSRSGRTDAAVALAIELAEMDMSDELLAGAIVRTLFDAGRVDEAISAGERLIAEGWDSAMIRACVGSAYMMCRGEDRYEKAIAHFHVGLAFAPDDVRINSAMGEALLRTRGYDQAIPYLEKACNLQPRVAQARALYARALKQAGRYADSAVEFRRLLELQPAESRWRRYAAGALSQAGRRKEAADLFGSFVGDRRKSLPKSFEKGLEALWDRVDSVEIPQARLDWAWRMSNLRPNDRGDWERRARWGHLADHYLLDWLECRDDRVHEAMMRLADLSEPERIFAEVDARNGLILASAHIGPMYAGPLALELLGVKSRWLASTPSVARTAYASSLISTSDQDDLQVARSFMQSLKQRYAVVIAIDGAINLAAPRIMFEGQEMTYSSFAARTAHKMGVPSLFCAPKWEGDRIGFVLERLPDPHPDEGADSHAERWKQAYLSHLRDYLGGQPENLRLSGGLWRHIR
jgi:tetratricopeptide (TPR) repeat protein